MHATDEVQVSFGHQQVQVEGERLTMQVQIELDLPVPASDERLPSKSSSRSIRPASGSSERCSAWPWRRPTPNWFWPVAMAKVARERGGAEPAR